MFHPDNFTSTVCPCLETPSSRMVKEFGCGMLIGLVYQQNLCPALNLADQQQVLISKTKWVSHGLFGRGKRYIQVKISRFCTRQSLGCWPLLSNAGAGVYKYSSDDAVFVKRGQHYFWKIIPDFTSNDFVAYPPSNKQQTGLSVYLDALAMCPRNADVSSID